MPFPTMPLEICGPPFIGSKIPCMGVARELPRAPGIGNGARGDCGNRYPILRQRARTKRHGAKDLRLRRCASQANNERKNELHGRVLPHNENRDRNALGDRLLKA